MISKRKYQSLPIRVEPKILKNNFSSEKELYEIEIIKKDFLMKIKRLIKDESNDEKKIKNFKKTSEIVQVGLHDQPLIHDALPNIPNLEHLEIIKIKNEINKRLFDYKPFEKPPYDDLKSDFIFDKLKDTQSSQRSDEQDSDIDNYDYEYDEDDEDESQNSDTSLEDDDFEENEREKKYYDDQFKQYSRDSKQTWKTINCVLGRGKYMN